MWQPNYPANKIMRNIWDAWMHSNYEFGKLREEFYWKFSLSSNSIPWKFLANSLFLVLLSIGLNSLYILWQFFFRCWQHSDHDISNKRNKIGLWTFTLFNFRRNFLFFFVALMRENICVDGEWKLSEFFFSLKAAKLVFRLRF